MALSLGVRVGSRIRIGEDEVVVKSIHSPTLIILTVKGHDTVITDQSRCEILPEVFVFTGLSSGGSGSRLAFEAPKRIRITRLNRFSAPMFSPVGNTNLIQGKERLNDHK